MDDDANAGLPATDPAFIDTREGSFYWDVTQVALLEIVRLWDAFTEAIAAAFPSTAWGEYLDEHGVTFNLARNPAVAAQATVLFTTDKGSVTIPTNTQVSAEPSTPSGEAVVFQTTQSGTTAAQLAPPGGVTVTAAGTGGSLTAGTYIYHITAYNQFGETLGSADQAGTIATSTGKNTVSWSAVTGATGYRVYRTMTAHTLGQQIADTATLSFVDTGTVTPSTLEPTVNSTAGALIPAQAITAGADGNLAADAISTLDTPLADVIAVSNPTASLGGADPEDDDAFRQRILAQFQSHGGGTIADYERWVLAFGVERVSVVPLFSGPGTVLVVAMMSDGSPVASSEVTALQAYLDPVAGQGHGQAPIGATVTVATSSVLSVAVSATVTFEPGYSLDGVTGDIPRRQAITDSLSSYVQSLEPGNTLVYQHVLAAFFVAGVHSVSGMTVNGGTSDIVLTTSPTPQVAQLATPTLS